MTDAAYPPSAYRVSWLRAIPFILVHAAAIAGVVWVGFSWTGVLLALGFYYLRMFAVTAGYHRYFSHRAFKTSRVFQLVLAFLAETSAQKGVIWWASHHRRHHKFSDTTEDVHSVKQRGFWWAHVGWILSDRWNATETERVPDLLKFPELVWLDRFYLVPPVVMAVAIFLVGGWPALVWGFFVSTVLTYHGTFFINSLMHLVGKRRYATTDESKNSFVLAVVTMGEGWHNNHHYYQRSASQGFFWWEWDPTFYILKLLEVFHVVSDVNRPPRHVRDQTIAKAERAEHAAHDAHPLPAE